MGGSEPSPRETCPRNAAQCVSVTSRAVTYDYDLVVIGSGPAGEKGAAQAAYFGKTRGDHREGAEKPGGAAVHTGTLPSKTLRETALFLSGHRQRELYGIYGQLDRSLAVPKLMSRKDAVVDQEVERIHWNLDRHRSTTLHGPAKLVDRAHDRGRRPARARRRVTRRVHPDRDRLGRRFTRATSPSTIRDIDDSDSILAARSAADER